MPKKDGRKRLVLLDAHAILHRAYHALPDFSTSKGEPTGALYGLSTMVIKIIEDLKPDYVIACYDLPGPTYRHEVYTAYKAKRQKTDNDLIIQINRSRDIFKALNVPIYDKTGFEADDIIGTIVEQVMVENTDKTIEIIIASGDMDTLQLVKGDRVRVYTLKKGIKDTIIYDQETVKDRYGFGPELMPDYKGLRGDPSDNIIGVKGIGEKTATILIKTFGTIENVYLELEAGHHKKFEEAGISERIIGILGENKEEAEFSKMLATIRRDAPIQFVIPDKSFKQSIEMSAIGSLWNELEFRTLIQRLKKVLDQNIDGGINNDKEKKQDITAEEVEKVGLALWLVRSDITNPKLEDILQFAQTDDFAKATEKIMAELVERSLGKVYENIELPLIPITHAMEKRGIKIDRAELLRLSEVYHKELSRLEKDIWEHAGGEFNINSPKQLGEILFDTLGLTAKNMKKTGGGARSTRESELEKLRTLHPIVPLLFEYRELQKLLSTYIDAIPPLLDSDDRLHTDFIPSGSTTGRMASRDPNLQNIPIKSDLGRAIRKAFVSSKDSRLVAFDYSQMELRIAAFLSGDTKMIDIFRRGDDVHASVAAEVFKVKAEDVTSDMRRQAKVINFGIIYGMGVTALQSNLGTTRAMAQKFYAEYFQAFSGLAEYIDRIKTETVDKGYTETYFGRRRYFEGIKSKIPYIRAQAERMAVNAPIQGTGADIIKLAMIRIDEYIQKENLREEVFALLQVHDELIYEVKDDKVDIFAVAVKKIMESVIDPALIHGIVLIADAHIGNNWGELK